MYRFPSHFFRLLPLLWVIAGAGVLSGCVRSHAVVSRQAVVAGAAAKPAAPVAWFGPALEADAHLLGRWRRSVGPPVSAQHGPAAPVADRLIVVNWNVHVGAGDVSQLFKDIKVQVAPGTPIVLLLQEAYRSGEDVPHALDASAMFAGLIRSTRRDGRREEVQSLAAGLGLHGYYAPSMRNGGPLISDEDRGNAILSTVPLDELSAIELPFERQRRVAVGATIGGETTHGEPWRLRVVSAHLDNMGGARRLWIAGGEFARARQVRALLHALDDEAPLILGADLNTWFGFHDSAYRLAARAFPQTRVTDRRTTFRGLLRLDHLFFRLGDGWRATFRRAESNYGSDHYPLIGTVEFR